MKKYNPRTYSSYKESVNAARARKLARAVKEEEEKQLKADVENLKHEIGDIKQLLTQLVEKL